MTRTLKRSLSTSSNYASFKRSRTMPSISARATPAIRRYVAKAVQRYAELKNTNTFAVSLALQGATGVSQVPQVLIPMPQLSQGTGEGGRIGNRIDVKKLHIQLSFMYQPYNATTNALLIPVVCKAWLVELIPNAAQFTAAQLTATGYLASFFQLGNASASFQGNMVDMHWDVNTDLWKVHDVKTVTIGQTAHAGTLAGSQVGNYPCSRKVTLKAKKLGTFMYEHSGVFPTNRNLYVLTTYAHTDGSTTLATANPVDYTFTSGMSFTDL